MNLRRPAEADAWGRVVKVLPPYRQRVPGAPAASACFKSAWTYGRHTGQDGADRR